jgi:hypothetical protein
MNDDQNNEKKVSNAKVAFFIALIPVGLFIASFFIQGL